MQAERRLELGARHRSAAQAGEQTELQGREQGLRRPEGHANFHDSSRGQRFQNHLLSATSVTRVWVTAGALDRISHTQTGSASIVFCPPMPGVAHIRNVWSPSVEDAGEIVPAALIVTNAPVQRRRADARALALYPSPSAATGCFALARRPLG